MGTNPLHLEKLATSFTLAFSLCLKPYTGRSHNSYWSILNRFAHTIQLQIVVLIGLSDWHHLSHPNIQILRFRRSHQIRLKSRCHTWIWRSKSVFFLFFKVTASYMAFCLTATHSPFFLASPDHKSSQPLVKLMKPVSFHTSGICWYCRKACQKNSH